MGLSYITQLILSISASSFQFGYGIGNLNAITSYVISTQGWCDDPNILTCDTPRRHLILDLSIFAGAALGCLVVGNFMNYGRRYLFMRIQVLIILGCAGQAFFDDYWVFVFARLCFGVAIGMVCVVCPVYIMEMADRQLTGINQTLHQMMTAIGTVVGISIGALLPQLEDGNVLPYAKYSLLGYRAILGAPAVIAFFTLILFSIKFREETPPFLIASNCIFEAGQLLRKIHEVDDVEPELEALLREDEEAAAEYDVLTVEKAWVEYPRLRSAVVIGLTLALLQPLTGINAFIAKSVDLLDTVGVEKSRVVTVIMALLNLVISLPGFYVMEKFSRRVLMIVAAVGQVITLLPAAIVGHFFRDSCDEYVYQYLTVFAMLGCTSFFAIGGPTMWVYLNEMYPRVLRESVIKFSAFVNWVSTLCILSCSSLWKLEVFFCLCSAAAVLDAIIMIVAAPETHQMQRSPYSDPAIGASTHKSRSAEEEDSATFSDRSSDSPVHYKL